MLISGGSSNLDHTVIIILVDAFGFIRVGVGTMVQSSIDVFLVLAGYAILAVALADTTLREPYGVGNEFHWGAEYR